MSWNISLQVVDGKVDPDTLRASGDLPEGSVSLYGHHNPRGNGFGMNVDGASTSAFLPYPEDKSNDNEGDK